MLVVGIVCVSVCVCVCVCVCIGRKVFNYMKRFLVVVYRLSAAVLAPVLGTKGDRGNRRMIPPRKNW